MTAVWDAATSAPAVYAQIERRLVDGGAVIELDQLHRLSADEVDLLLWLERNE